MSEIVFLRSDMVSELTFWSKQMTFTFFPGHFPLIFLTFSNTFLVTKRVAVGAIEFIAKDFSVKISMRMPILSC